MKKTFWAIRNKENGLLYRFDQLNEDGYGVFRCDVYGIGLDEMPALFDKPVFPISKLLPPGGWSHDDGCTTEDIKWVKVDITVED